jgi:hypothetical protein
MKIDIRPEFGKLLKDKQLDPKQVVDKLLRNYLNITNRQMIKNAYVKNIAIELNLDENEKLLLDKMIIKHGLEKLNKSIQEASQKQSQFQTWDQKLKAILKYGKECAYEWSKFQQLHPEKAQELLDFDPNFNYTRYMHRARDYKYMSSHAREMANRVDMLLIKSKKK